MSRITPTLSSQQTTGLEQRQSQRIRFCSKVFRVVLVLFGLGAAIAQLIKFSPIGGVSFEFSDIVAFILGLGLLVLGRGQAITRMLCAALGDGRSRAKNILFATPWILGLIALALKLSIGETRTYKMMLTEGGFIEYGTMLAFLLMPFFAIPVGHYFRKQGQWLLGLGYYLVAGLAFFVGMEEISWGQMLIGWQGSEFFVQNNSQAETNLHNMFWIRDYFRLALLSISGLGCLGCFGYFFTTQIKSLSRNLWAQFILPEWPLYGFFAVTLMIYLPIVMTNGQGFIAHSDQEFAELILSLGFLTFTVNKYLKQVEH